MSAKQIMAYSGAASLLREELAVSNKHSGHSDVGFSPPGTMMHATECLPVCFGLNICQVECLSSSPVGPLSLSITKVEVRGLLGGRRIRKATESKVRVMSRSKTKFSRRLLSVSIKLSKN